ncbi:MAG: hypothetical protein JRH20_01415 [Deltaproteobacteria bacterium]|nr:hypothetical protein [Deltaproteobacteria bacterium]
MTYKWAPLNPSLWLLGGVLLCATPALAAVGDADDDTISDMQEGRQEGRDSDRDGRDSDRDGMPDYLDLDSDGDGIADILEAGDADLVTPPVDTDGDGLFDYVDVDSDNDGVPDAVEDANGNGVLDPGETSRQDSDSDGDGLLDGDEDKNFNGQVDPGESNPFDDDSDNDGILDGVDLCPLAPEDLDAIEDDDGCPELDADGDGLRDDLEAGHACLDPLHPDVDGDGLLDGVEDLNADGIVDDDETDPCDADTDDDEINDADDNCPLEFESSDDIGIRDGCPDTPGDGLTFDSGPVAGDAAPDAGADRDGDGLPDALEQQGCTDWDNPDSDGDGRWDGQEDENHNGRQDEGESDPCAPDIDPVGGGILSCEVPPSSTFSGVGWWLSCSCLALVFWRRRGTKLPRHSRG